jgi:hypothetical protein
MLTFIQKRHLGEVPRYGIRQDGTGVGRAGRIHTYSFAAILENGGQTPAVNVVTNTSCRKLTNDAIARFDFPDSDLVGHGLIGPRGELHTSPIRIRENEFEEIIADSRWYFWGWVEYDDIFYGTMRHRTEFCFQIGTTRLQPTNEFWVAFTPHSAFNAADDECRRPIDPHTNESGPDRAPPHGADS